jgi:hypothetical protein
MNDTARVDALLNLDINVLPAEDGEWLLVDFRQNPPKTTGYKTGRDAIDAAINPNPRPASPVSDTPKTDRADAKLRSLLAVSKHYLEEHQDTATGQSEHLRNLIGAIDEAMEHPVSPFSSVPE